MSQKSWDRCGRCWLWEVSQDFWDTFYLVFLLEIDFFLAQKSLTGGWEITFDQPNFQEGYKIEVFIFATGGSSYHILVFGRNGILSALLTSKLCLENDQDKHQKQVLRLFPISLIIETIASESTIHTLGNSLDVTSTSRFLLTSVRWGHAMFPKNQI